LKRTSGALSPFWQRFLKGAAQAGMIVADHEFHPVQRPMATDRPADPFG